MTVAWSSSVNTVRLLPISKVPYDQRGMFQVQGGAPKFSAISSTQIFVVGFDMIFSGTELGAFWTWWNSTLVMGTDKFTGLTDVVTDAAATYQFMSAPTFNMIRAGNATISRYRGSLQLIQYS